MKETRQLEFKSDISNTFLMFGEAFRIALAVIFAYNAAAISMALLSLGSAIEGKESICGAIGYPFRIRKNGNVVLFTITKALTRCNTADNY